MLTHHAAGGFTPVPGFLLTEKNNYGIAIIIILRLPLSIPPLWLLFVPSSFFYPHCTFIFQHPLNQLLNILPLIPSQNKANKMPLDIFGLVVAIATAINADSLIASRLCIQSACHTEQGECFRTM